MHKHRDPRPVLTFLILPLCILLLRRTAFSMPAIDQSRYQLQPGGVAVHVDAAQLTADWPISETTNGRIVLSLSGDHPLISNIAIIENKTTEPRVLLSNVDPVWVLTVGTRDLKAPSGWIAFFDDPYKRPHKSYLAERNTRVVTVTSIGKRCEISLDGLTAGPFKGELRFDLYPGCNLLQFQAAVTTSTDSLAIIYDTGLTGAFNDCRDISFVDAQEQWHHIAINNPPAARPLAVAHRALFATSDRGCLAMLPPPHQFFYPLDFVDNYGFTWAGTAMDDLVPAFGFGLHQTVEGDRRHVPWVNAPPGSLQKLSAFCLLSDGGAPAALQQVLAFTHGDRFEHLDGFKTFTSHFHVEHTLTLLDEQKKLGNSTIPPDLVEPDFIRRFKKAGVDIAHLAEFHIGWTKTQTAHRLDLLKLMHDECRRLSNDQFLLLPGEEPDVHLGGHWLSLFPKPVYWTLERGKNQPFSEEIAGYGTVYHTGSASDVLKMMQAEQGFMWTAHPRIKGSFGFPDIYKNQDFFRSDRFLGEAWKAMPADDSLPKLGTRVLDLLDDTSNWGLHKYALGEVDIFKIKDDAEYYGHANINYLKLDSLPRFNDGWSSVLNALATGKMFVTTGEVLIPEYTIDGKNSGETISMPNDKSVLHAKLNWTFPLAFAQIITGDGSQVDRQTIDLSDTSGFGSRALDVPINLHGKTWARFEVWDIAANGAFTEPIWIDQSNH